jgi:hypothetical protein
MKGSIANSTVSSYGCKTLQGTNFVISTCSTPSATNALREFTVTPCFSGDIVYSIVGSNTVVQSCRSVLNTLNVYISALCVPGSAFVAGSDVVTTSCSAPSDGYFTSSACISGSANYANPTLGTPPSFSQCMAPTPTNYVTTLCVPGSSSSLGSNTGTTVCSGAPTGKFVTQICVGGSYKLLGSDTVATGTCSSPGTSSYVRVYVESLPSRCVNFLLFYPLFLLPVLVILGIDHVLEQIVR